MQDTIFEKIVAREVPATIIYEDDTVLAFLDITPVNHGHTLVIPKKKFRNALDADVPVFAHMAEVAQKIAVALKNTLPCDGVNIAMNNEPSAGQEVFHAHFHVIPRYTGDEAFVRPTHVEYNDKKAQEIAASLRSILD